MKEEFDPIVCINEYRGKCADDQGVEFIIPVHPATHLPFIDDYRCMTLLRAENGFWLASAKIPEALSYPKPSEEEQLKEALNNYFISDELKEGLVKTIMSIFKEND